VLVLKPGVYLDCSAQAQLRFLTSDSPRTIEPEQLRDAESLALGELSEEPAWVRELMEENLVIAGDDTLDPMVAAALERLDRRFAWTGTDDSARHRILGAHARRRRLQRAMGQHPALPETVVRRARLAGSSPRDILVLGDDDMVSLALAAAGHRVSVVDGDPYLVRLLKQQSQRLGLEISVRRWDFRQAMPEDLRESFELVFTDPMSSAACLPLFVNRALSALRPEGTVWVAVNRPAARIFDVHRRETRAGLVEHFTDFNHYYTADLQLSAYVSDLYGLTRLAPTCPTLAPEEGFYGSDLYDEETYGRRLSSRFVIRDIELELADLLHIQTLVDEAKALAGIEFDDTLVHWHEDYRTFVGLLPGGRVMSISVSHEHRACEMLLTPPDDAIERVFQACLMSLYCRGDEASHQISRLRSELSSQLT